MPAASINSCWRVVEIVATGDTKEVKVGPAINAFQAQELWIDSTKQVASMSSDPAQFPFNSLLSKCSTTGARNGAAEAMPLGCKR